MPLLDPKIITIKDLKDKDRKYKISLVPAIPGRELVCNYPVSALPKPIGDYKVNEGMALKLLSYVEAITDNGSSIPLENETMINQHVPDYKTMMKLEMEMMEYNCFFFEKGTILNFLKSIAPKATALATKILTDSSVQSFLKEKLPSKN